METPLGKPSDVNHGSALRQADERECGGGARKFRSTGGGKLPLSGNFDMPMPFSAQRLRKRLVQRADGTQVWGKFGKLYNFADGDYHETLKSS